MIPWLSPTSGHQNGAEMRRMKRHARLHSLQPGRDSFRRVVSRGPLALIEDGSVAPELSPAGYCPDLQVIITYEGLFAYYVGSRRLLVDSNQILLVGGDEEWRDEHPLAHMGHAAIVITPTTHVIDEVRDLTRGGQSHRYESATQLASTRARLTAQRLIFTQGDGDLRQDEAVLAVVDETLRGAAKVLPSPKHVERAKELLQAFAFERVRLDDVAREIGINPVYLTQLFKQTEGVPLYQYQLQLRLNQALRALPCCGDITALALELGFSSHSHFSAAFRCAFNMAPSQYRSEMNVRLGLPPSPYRSAERLRS